LKVGILKTGRPPRPAIERFGDYPAMFRRLLGEDAYEWRTYEVDEGELPAIPRECDAYIVTGSSCGVYDPLPWIADAKAWLNEAKGEAKLVGVCFGHQLMAEAFGGKVIQSPKGWGVGEHEYEVLKLQPWMDDVPAVRLPASHQDQVVELPPGAEIVAANEFTPMGALAWRDHPSISLQLHPEFEPSYAVALIEHRRGDRYTQEQADAAIHTYGRPDDRARVGGWIRDFLSGAAT
jgi:GMP synthase-like glutamine amidotransferase